MARRPLHRPHHQRARKALQDFLHQQGLAAQRPALPVIHLLAMPVRPIEITMGKVIAKGGAILLTQTVLYRCAGLKLV
jgi:hypothetical protein